MSKKVYGRKVELFQRTMKAETWVGQARIPEWKYFSYPYEYDTSKEEYVDAYKVGLVVAQHPEKLTGGGANPSAGMVAPYKKDDPLLGTPFGMILETRDLERDVNVPVYLKGAWDASVVPISGFTDINDPAETAKGFNGRMVKADGKGGGVFFWDGTLPA